MITFTVPGPPRGKARARTCRNRHSYTPENTVLYENLVKTEFQRQCGRQRATIDGKPALKMEIVAVYPVPSSYSKRKTVSALAGDLLPADKTLYAQIMGAGGVKTCASCGKPFRAVANRAKYCDGCRQWERRKQKAASERKRYYKNLDI